MKALLVPINSKKEILIQDRRGYREPDWGFFGGNIQGEETPLDSALRHAREELALELEPGQLAYIGVMQTFRNMSSSTTHLYLFKTDQEMFTVLQGAGAFWMSFEEAAKYLDEDHQLDKLVEKIEKLL